jgi:predicted MPP superfamily phosphohydrolase
MILSQTEKIDIIGDVHGHYQQLIRLTEKMGYSVGSKKLHHPESRKLGFVGDFINRGPQSVEVLTLVKSLCESGDAIAVLGNHEFRLIQNSVDRERKCQRNSNHLFHGSEHSLFLWS